MRHESRGVSLIETVVGLAVLASGLLSVTLLVVTTRELGARARDETVAMWLARAKLAQLDALTFASARLPSGGTVLLTDVTTDLSVDPHGLGGAGLSPSPADALESDRPGYAEYLDDTGRSLATGDRTRAVWVRRWAIARRGAGAGELVALDVLVARTAVASRVPGRHLPAHPLVVRLSSARARRAS
jgi:hypothetical protein